jgi:glycosyltransferase involved in cell wall biosynthesis
MNPKVALIFRSEIKKRFSIEKVFQPLESLFLIKKLSLNFELDSISSFFKILFFCFKIKQKIIHVTGDVHYVIWMLFWKKSILTVHDLNHLEAMPNGIRRTVYKIIWFDLPFLFANKIIAISPYTQSQIQKHFAILPGKIEVIPNSFHSNIDVEFNKPSSTNVNFKILTIGNAENKNLLNLIKAVSGIKEIEIHFVGLQSQEILNQLIKHNIAYSVSSNLSEKELSFKYFDSNLLYFVSTKEGFGLPILEAQSRGIPVLTSITTSMPFVAGDGALFANPYDVEDIRNKILIFVTKKIDIDVLIKKGHENTKRFNIESFISSYQRVYSEMIIN